MRKLILILGFVALWFVASVGWQIGSCELSRIEFQDDLHDRAAQLALISDCLNQVRTGNSGPLVDYGQKVRHSLDPSQIMVQRIGPANF